MRNLLLWILAAAVLPLSSAAAAAQSGVYRPDWESLIKHQHAEWLLDAKFGIYAHWGVYSVAAFKSEWYGKMMYDPDDRREAKLVEVMDKYRPDVLWFDGGDFTSPDVAQSVMSSLAYYYNQAAARKTPVEVLNKFAGTRKFNFPEEFGILTYEAGRDRPEFVAKPWIDDQSIAEQGWGYAQDQAIRTPREIVLGFVDRVSRGGGLLLSLAPMANGVIPENQKLVLREMGEWLKVNGEAIYGTRSWKVQAEGSTEKLVYDQGGHKRWRFDAANAEDVRFTRKGNDLYAIALGWPEDGKLRIRTLKKGTRIASGGIAGISLLGSKVPVRWKQTAEALEVELPSEKPCKHAYALKLAVKGNLE